MAPKKFTIHYQSGGSGRGEGGSLVVTTLMFEGDLEPVNYWATIRFGSSIDDPPSETAPRLDRREVPIEEHVHIEGQEVNCFSDSDVVHTSVFVGEWT